MSDKSNATLEAVIAEYKSAKKDFESCPDMIRSHSIPPASQKISERYFAARERLEAVCKDSPLALAQEYYTKAQLAHECAKMMCDRFVDRSNECARRMREYDEITNKLLELT